jgi:hypothetical protein
MALKFRLKGLAETFIENLRCPKCGHDGGEEGDQKFRTDHTRVTFDGIVVVIECEVCGQIFVPPGQRCGIIDPQKLRLAVEKDSDKTGQPVCPSIKEVILDVERLNAVRNSDVH